MDSPDETAQFRMRQLQAAIDHLTARRWRMAEVQCRILLAVNPTDVEGMLVLGLAIAASGEAAECSARVVEPDFNEAMTAFFEKRPPHFAGTEPQVLAH